MCGIFGIVDGPNIDKKSSLFYKIGKLSQRRGQDSSGIIWFNKKYNIAKTDNKFTSLYKKVKPVSASLIAGHTRLITNSEAENQPVRYKDIILLHNGIILNDKEILLENNYNGDSFLDSTALAVAIHNFFEKNLPSEELSNYLSNIVSGTYSIAAMNLASGKIILATNNGSLFIGKKNGNTFFASEKNFLISIGVKNINQVINPIEFKIPICEQVKESYIAIGQRNNKLIYPISSYSKNSNFLQYDLHNIRRCSKCILPETFPFIKFNSSGECNYCENEPPLKSVSDIRVFEKVFDKYEGSRSGSCLVPFSGGRDSSYALHLIVKELGVRPVTFTYDWGLVTDVARRNISLMCSKLGVENIIIADNLEYKRNNVRKNLIAWLKKPDLGMLHILMAGDKHFFRYCEKIKKELGITLNIWGMNPYEKTHFKAGFLGFPPDFMSDQVFYTGIKNQFNFHKLRTKKMFKNPGYLNASLFDTFYGEFHRSIANKDGFHNIYDYFQWDEKISDKVLDDYEWEKSEDLSSTWRIGDGTAAFYNYIFYHVAGFTEFDTFRSNQIRNGAITRDEALAKVEIENRPRYQSIRWYLDIVGLDFEETFKVINKMEKMY